jgi:hypothetical protein
MRGFLRFTGSTLRGRLFIRSSPAAAVEPSRFALLRRCSFLFSPAVRLGCGGPDLLWWVAVFSVFSSHLPPRVGKFGGPKGRWWRCHTPLLCVSKPVRVGSVLLPVVVGSFSTSAVV